MSVLIIGGGISGLTAGWKLAQKGHSITLLEAESYLGGLAATLHDGPYHLDFGPHSFFTEDDEIRETVKHLFPDQSLRDLPRTVKFNFRGRYLDYPFTPYSILIQMGFWEGLRSLLSFFTSKLKSKPSTVTIDHLSVKDWAVASFGPRFYETFFKPYTEQFWQMPAEELSARSIPSHTRLSFKNALLNLLRRTAPAGKLNQLEREKLPTYYPRTGYGEIAERLAIEFVKSGGQFSLGCRVSKLTAHRGTFQAEWSDSSGIKHSATFDSVISTVPVPALIDFLEPKPPQAVQDAAAKLEYRPIVFLGIAVKKRPVLKASYIYTLHRPYNRLTDFSQFSEATSPEGESILGLEIPCGYGGTIWNSSAEQLFELCLPSLEKDGIIRRSDAVKFFLAKNRSAYPVYKLNYAAALKPVLEQIRTIPNLHTLGRSGEFCYMDADQCMRKAFDLAKTYADEKSANRS